MGLSGPSICNVPELVGWYSGRGCVRAVAVRCQSQGSQVEILRATCRNRDSGREVLRSKKFERKCSQVEVSRKVLANRDFERKVQREKCQDPGAHE